MYYFSASREEARPVCISLVARPSLTAFFFAAVEGSTAAKKAVREGLGMRLGMHRVEATHTHTVQFDFKIFPIAGGETA